MKTKLFSLLAVAALFAAACEKNDNPGENGGGNEQPPVEEQFNDIFGEQITAVTESTLWSDDVFNAIIEKNNAGQTTWDFTATADKLGFVENNLGFYGGVWKDAEGADKAGTFKFKKDEKISDTAKKSRVQIGGGKVGERSFIAFRAGGKGTLTLIARSSGEEERFINVALNADLLSEKGYSAPVKTEAPATHTVEIKAANGDVITILSMGSSINVYSIKWIPEGKADIEDGQGGQGGDDPTPTPDPANDPSTAYDPATLEAVSELTTWGATDFNALFKGKVASNKDVTTTAGESFVYNKLVYLAGEGGAFKFTESRVQLALGEYGVKNNLAFKVSGPGTVTVKAIGASSTDDSRKVVIGLNDAQKLEEGVENGKGAIKEFSIELSDAANGDLVYICGPVGALNIHEVQWAPSGAATPTKELAEGWNFIANNGSNADYSVYNGELTLSGSGKFESAAQAMGIIYRDFEGDFTATVKLVSYTPSKTGSNQAVAGIVVIDGDAAATGTDLVYSIGGGNYYGNFRKAAGENRSGFTLSAPETSGNDVVIKLVREGNKVKYSYSLDGGATYGNVSSKEFTNLSAKVKVGLGVSSGDSTNPSTAVFSDFVINDETIAF